MQNIIFDLGNVLINYNPREYLKQQNLTPEETDFLMKELYGSPEWVELDLGTITRQEALKAITERHVNRKDLILQYARFEDLLTPIEENIAIYLALVEKGYPTYYLSNYHKEAFENARTSHPFFKHFRGGIVSAYVNAVKPGREIYRILLDTYNLNPADCLFIDDTKANTQTAAALDFQTLHLPTPKDLSPQLKSLNLI